VSGKLLTPKELDAVIEASALAFLNENEARFAVHQQEASAHCCGVIAGAMACLSAAGLTRAQIGNYLRQCLEKVPT